MNTDLPPQSNLQMALEAFLQTATLEEAYQLLEQYPELLTDQADLLLSSIISDAYKQGHETTAMALDERRDFIRSVREELSEPK